MDTNEIDTNEIDTNKIDTNEMDNIEETDNNNENKLDLDLNNICVKIIDFGNAEHMDRREHDTIYTRSYRPPENIIDYQYDTKSDIWVIGCMLYELLNGDSLFDLRDYEFKNNIDKDRKHIMVF